MHKFLFTKGEHLRAIINPGEYCNTLACVVAVNYNAQQMMNDRVEGVRRLLLG